MIGTNYTAQLRKHISTANTLVEGASVTVPTGTYIVYASWRFESTSGSASSSEIGIYVGSQADAYGVQLVYMPSTWFRVLSTMAFVTVSTSTKIYVGAKYRWWTTYIY